MAPHVIGRTAFRFIVIFGAAITALGLFAGLGIGEISILSVVGGGAFLVTMRLIDRPPT
jgi:hypothetical protein